MFRIASLLPRPPILVGLVLACLYLSLPSAPAEAVAPAIRATTAAWSTADPSLAPLTILAAALGGAGLTLRLRQRRSG